MEQIKSNNYKTTVIMENLLNKVKNIFSKPAETKEEVVAEKKEAVINLDKEFTLDVINTKGFVQWLKQDIKNLVADQKIAKRDRKDVNHPCPEKRVYGYYKAIDKVNSNRERLRIRYLLYYLLRKVRDFRWDQYRVTDNKYYGNQYISYDYTLAEYMFHHSCKIDKILSDHGNWNYVQGQILNVVKDYVKFTSNLKRRLYVIIDESLDPVYGCVQGGHAVAQYLVDHGTSEWKNNYLIYLYGNTDYWRMVLKHTGIKFSEFREPDLGGKLTALAVVNDGGMFKKLKKVS